MERFSLLLWSSNNERISFYRAPSVKTPTTFLLLSHLSFETSSTNTPLHNRLQLVYINVSTWNHISVLVKLSALERQEYFPFQFIFKTILFTTFSNIKTNCLGFLTTTHPISYCCLCVTLDANIYRLFIFVLLLSFGACYLMALNRSLIFWMFCWGVLGKISPSGAAWLPLPSSTLPAIVLGN